MGIPISRICINEFFCHFTGICIYGIDLRLYLRCTQRTRGNTIIRYFIADSSFPLSITFQAIHKHKPTFICYRNKTNPTKEEIIEFANFAKNHSKLFINYDSITDKTIIKYFDGIHFPSSYIKDLKNLKTLFPDKIFITSTHFIEEVKNSLISDYITFSPIFDSKGRKGKGIDFLNKITDLHPNVIALGGIISDKEVKKIKNSKALGFASIRYFYN